MSDARGRGVARQVHSGVQARGQASGQARPAARKAKTPTAGWRQRFGFIIAFVLATLIGLPLANALMGEVAAMVLAAFIGGFALGRMTLKRG
ncbi:MAG: hypothetical protein ACKOC9_10070 [Alphaproteobacteria bacterium]